MDCDTPAPGVIDLPAFEHIEPPRLPITASHPDGYLLKRDHVGQAPAVWIDDNFTALDHQRAADRTRARHPTLLIQSDHYAGLQSEDVVAQHHTEGAGWKEWVGLQSGPVPRNPVRITVPSVRGTRRAVAFPVSPACHTTLQGRGRPPSASVMSADMSSICWTYLRLKETRRGRAYRRPGCGCGRGPPSTRRR